MNEPQAKGEIMRKIWDDIAIGEMFWYSGYLYKKTTDENAVEINRATRVEIPYTNNDFGDFVGARDLFKIEREVNG